MFKKLTKNNFFILLIVLLIVMGVMSSMSDYFPDTIVLNKCNKIYFRDKLDWTMNDTGYPDRRN